MNDLTRRDALLAAVGVTLAGAGAAAAEEDTAPKAKHDVKQIESRCKDLTQSLKALADEKDFDELMVIIRKPGWTTPAEFLLVNGLLDAMNAQAKHLAGLKQMLLAGARAVPTK